MRRYTWLFLSIGLVFSLVGCGGSGNGNGGSGGSGSGGSGGSGTMVTVTGTVAAAALEGEATALGGATVSVVGTSNTATSGPDGSFSIMAPVGTMMFQATAEGHWGSLFAENVPEAGLTDLEVEVLPDALVSTVASIFETTADESKGLVAVFFDEDTTSGDESASLSATSELSFIFDADDEPVEGDTLCGEAGCGSDVIFINTDVGAVTATALNASSQPCPLEYPSASYSVQAKMFTEIDVYCP